MHVALILAPHLVIRGIKFLTGANRFAHGLEPAEKRARGTRAPLSLAIGLSAASGGMGREDCHCSLGESDHHFTEALSGELGSWEGQ